MSRMGSFVHVRRSDGQMEDGQIVPPDPRYLSRDQVSRGYVLVRTGGNVLRRARWHRSVWPYTHSTSSRAAGAIPRRHRRTGPKTQSLYERLGGIYSIAAVIDHFSDAVVRNPIAGQDSKNPVLRDWHRNQLGRLPGLKWMRTLWVANVAGGPYKFVPTVPGQCPLGLENAHAKFRISPDEFKAVADELAHSLDHFKVPAKEKQEVLSAFLGHQPEVNTGFFEAKGQPRPHFKCPFAASS